VGNFEGEKTIGYELSSSVATAGLTFSSLSIFIFKGIQENSALSFLQAKK
jgi:hypothetical protein